MYGKAKPQAACPPTPDVRPILAPRRVAVIARDFQREITGGAGSFRDPEKGFAPHIQRAIRAASDNGADAVLFSLWSHNASKFGELSPSDFFPRGTHHSTVILGVVRRDGKTRKDREITEVWHRPSPAPFVFSQLFGKTSARKASKKSLSEGLPQRQFGAVIVLLCGEVNIVKTQRSKRGIVDEFGFLRRLRDSGIECILNPIHTYMRRYEMGLKREALSREAGRLISVWNRRSKKGAESKAPWAVYRDGIMTKDAVREVALPVPAQPGIRMGIIDLQDLNERAGKERLLR
jgi:hypothetical protein